MVKNENFHKTREVRYVDKAKKIDCRIFDVGIIDGVEKCELKVRSGNNGYEYVSPDKLVRQLIMGLSNNLSKSYERPPDEIRKAREAQLFEEKYLNNQK